VSLAHILSQQLLKYNVDTFGKFMQGITRDYEEQVNANKKLRFEIEKMKLQLQFGGRYVIQA